MTSRSPSYKVDHIGRTVKSTKLRHAWTLYLGDSEIKVELEHSRLTGKKKVLVDGKLLFSTSDRHLNWCWKHPESKAQISLISENGKHVLRCEEPEAAKETLEGESERSPEDSACLEPVSAISEPLLEEAAEAEAEIFSSRYSDAVRLDLSKRYADCEDCLKDQLASISGVPGHPAPMGSGTPGLQVPAGSCWSVL